MEIPSKILSSNEIIKSITKRFQKYQLSNFHPETLKELKKVSIQRTLNLICSAIAQKFGIFISELYPVGFFLEVVRGCNFKCIMCDAWKFRKSLITLEQAKKILPHFKKSLMFHAYGVGEPFLNRDIYDIVKYAAFELKFIVSITSNFSVIDPQKALDMGTNEIMASIDSVNAQIFHKIRQGSFELVKKNLNLLLKLKGKKKYPIISIRTVISKLNIHDLENIVKFGISLNIRKFYFQTLVDGNLCSKTNDIDTNEISEIHRVVNKYKREAKFIVTSYRRDFKGDVPDGYCPVAFSLASVDYRGNMYPCYRVVDDENASFGNIFSEPQKALKNRNIFLKNFRSSPPEFCKKCELYFRNFKKQKNFEDKKINNNGK